MASSSSLHFTTSEPHYTPEEDDRPGKVVGKSSQNALPGFIQHHPDPHHHEPSPLVLHGRMTTTTTTAGGMNEEDMNEEENEMTNPEGFYTETTRFVDCFDVIAIVVSFMPLDEAHAIRGVSRVWHSAAFEHVEGMRGQVKRFVIAYNEQVEHEMNSKVLLLDQKTKLAWMTWNTGTILIGILPWMYMDGPWRLPWNIPHLAAAILWFFFMSLSFLCYGHYVTFQMVKKATYPVFFSCLVIFLNVVGAISYTCIAIFPDAWVVKTADGGTKFRIGFAFYYLFVAFICFMYTNLPLFSLLQFFIPAWFSADGLRIHSKQIRNPISANIHENEDTGVEMIRATSSGSAGSFNAGSGVANDDGSKIGNLNEITEYDEVAERAEIEGNNKLPVLLACFFNVSEKFLKARRRVTIKEVIVMMEERRELWEQEAADRDHHHQQQLQQEGGEEAKNQTTTRARRNILQDPTPPPPPPKLVPPPPVAVPPGATTALHAPSS